MILFRSDYSSFFSDSFLDSENRGDGRVDSFGNIKQGSINGIDWKINHGSVTLSTFSPQALLLSCTNNLANAAVPHLITTWRVGKLPKKRKGTEAFIRYRADNLKEPTGVSHSWSSVTASTSVSDNSLKGPSSSVQTCFPLKSGRNLYFSCLKLITPGLNRMLEESVRHRVDLPLLHRHLQAKSHQRSETSKEVCFSLKSGTQWNLPLILLFAVHTKIDPRKIFP